MLGSLHAVSSVAAIPKGSGKATFVCVQCGFSANADFVAACNIREARLALLACSYPSGDVSPSAGTHRRYSCVCMRPVGILSLQGGEEVTTVGCMRNSGGMLAGTQSQRSCPPAFFSYRQRASPLRAFSISLASLESALPSWDVSCGFLRMAAASEK